MLVQFHTSYSVVAVVFILLVCFLKQVSQVLGCVANAMLDCVKSLDECLLCHVCLRNDLGRQCLILTLFIQPFLVSGVWCVNSSVLPARSSTVILHSLYVNTSMPTLVLDMAKSEVYEIDYLFFALPFAICISCSVLILAYLMTAGLMTMDATWDNNLDENVSAYEFMYLLELLTMNLSLVSASVYEQDVQRVLYFAFVLSGIQCYFNSLSRYDHSSKADQFLSIFFFCAMCLAIMLFWEHMADTRHTVTVFAAAVLSLCTLLHVTLHYSANGNLPLGVLVTSRQLIVLLPATLHIATLVLGRDRLRDMLVD